MCLSLVNLCLDTIVDHFPRYNLEFQTTKDELTKRKFEFLQKRYSYELLTKMSIKRESLKDFIDLLINKYLKIIDITWFKDCSWEKVTSKIAEIGPNLEKIVFPDDRHTFRLEIRWKDLMYCFPNLKFFTFRFNCNDLILKNVAEFCTNIEEIDIQSSFSITPEAAKYLCKSENGTDLCTKLRKLCIRDTLIGKDAVKILIKTLPSLEIIDYADLPLVLYSMHKNDFLSLDEVKPYNIKKLDVSRFTNKILKVCLSVCPHLKWLSCMLFSVHEFEYFSNLSADLENLQIEGSPVSVINLNDLFKDKCKNLTSLTLINCALSISVLADGCPHLKELILLKVDIYSDDSKLTFNSLSSVKFCQYHGGHIRHGQAISLLLLSSTKLESLSFHNCNNFPTELKANILKCCVKNSYKEISFHYSRIEKEFIKDLLLNCSTLDYLNIHHCFDRDDQDELLDFARIFSPKPKFEISDPVIEYVDSLFLDSDFDFDIENMDLDIIYGNNLI